MHLPSLPSAKDNTLGRLLVNPNTAPELGWALIEQVDPHSQIDGMSLLQAFCKERKLKSSHSVGLCMDHRAYPMPVSPDQPWPDPRFSFDGKMTDKFQSPEMWIFAHLVCNGPDPFSWRMEDGKDVLDFVIQWNSPQLLDQLLRMPSCPPPEQLQARLFNADKKQPWLHGVASSERDRMIQVLLDHGFDPHQRMAGQLTALHCAQSSRCAQVLIDAGVDVFAVDKKGTSIPTYWGEVAFSRQNAHLSSPEYALKQRLDVWSQAAKVDNARAIEAITPVVFEVLSHGRGTTIMTDACKHHGQPVEKWMSVSGRSVLEAMGRDSLRSQKSSLVPQMMPLLDTMPISSLVAPRKNGISDLAWCWLACRNHGAQHEAEAYLAKLFTRLQAAPHPFSEARQVWDAVACMVAASVPANQAKLLRGLEKACTREIYAMSQERAGRGSKHDTKGRIDALIEHPDYLLQMKDWPLEADGANAFVGFLRDFANEQPQLAGHCMVALANVLRGKSVEKRTTEGVFRALQALQEDGARWDPSLPGADAAMLALQEAARSAPGFGATTAQLLASCIQEQTRDAAASVSRPRL